MKNRTLERPSTESWQARRDGLSRFFVPCGLFPKIFGWFLAAQLVIALALYLLALATQRGFDQRFNEIIGEGLEARVRAAAIAYENGGRAAVREAWPTPTRDSAPPDENAPPQSASSKSSSSASASSASVRPGFTSRRDARRSLDGWNAPRNGRARDNLGLARRGSERRALNDIEASALYLLSGSPVPSLARHLAGPVAPAAQFTVPTGLASGTNTIFPFEGANYLMRRVDTAHGGHFLGVVVLRQNGKRPRRLVDWWLRHDGPNAGGQNSALWRLFVTALTMGVLCYALARYLTDPAIKLRRATRNFAAGDFSSRVGSQMGKRRDELADLGRDFDQMAERIENLLLAQRQLLGDISHELRSPLTRLSLALELAQDSADPKTCSYLERIESEVGELGGLIGQLLTLTKLENTSLDVSSQSREAAYLDLAHLVEHVARNADFEAQSRGGSVKIVRSAPCQTLGNGELLHSALENVVRNAILHSPGAPRVEISLGNELRPLPDPQSGQVREVKMAMIRVRDFGSGVPEAALEMLFRPFYRVSVGRERQSGGTGLGLSIAQRAARFHGGDVSARNAPGGGLEVEISLPLSDAETGEELA